MGTYRRHTKSVNRGLQAVPRDVQRRLLSLTAMLIVVVLLMQQAARPGSWSWLWGDAPSAPEAVADPATTPSRVGSPASADRTRGVLPGLDLALLEGVEDDTYFQKDEQSAWFAVMRELAATPENQLAALSVGPVSFLQIYRQTPEYRGRLVTLQGTIRRVSRVSAPDNAAGIDVYWQLWLFPDVRPFEPIVVYVLSPPAELREGLSLALPARIVGVVFKRWSFQAVRELKVAPVVLARSLELLELASDAAPASQAANRLPLTWPAILTTILAAVLFVVLLMRHRPRKPARPLGDSSSRDSAAAPDFAFLTSPSGQASDSVPPPDNGPAS